MRCVHYHGGEFLPVYYVEPRETKRVEVPIYPWTYDAPGQVCAIELQDCQTEKQGEEVVVVVLPKTVVDPRTMMVAFRHTVTTQRAVLASRWFCQMTGFADGIRSVEYMVVGIVVKSVVVVGGGNVH